MTREAILIRPERPVPYGVANEAMHRLAERRLAGDVPDTVILLEHPPVFTAGRRARPDELLWSADEVAARGAEVHRIDRGGAFTFHGPGQLVGYPILDLGPKPDAAAHLRRLEEAVIRTASELGVALHRRGDVQTGVWRGDAKVCAIGVRLMRARVTLHGFALNCDPDLAWFDGIVACGLPGHGVSSLTRLAGRPVTVSEVEPILERHLAEVFDLDLVPAPEPVARLLRPVTVSLIASAADP
jgi:lipoyl(octanoyl) transferase